MALNRSDAPAGHRATGTSALPLAALRRWAWWRSSWASGCSTSAQARNACGRAGRAAAAGGDRRPGLRQAGCPPATGAPERALLALYVVGRWWRVAPLLPQLRPAGPADRARPSSSGCPGCRGSLAALWPALLAGRRRCPCCSSSCRCASMARAPVLETGRVRAALLSAWASPSPWCSASRVDLRRHRARRAGRLLLLPHRPAGRVDQEDRPGAGQAGRRCTCSSRPPTRCARRWRSTSPSCPASRSS